MSDADHLLQAVVDSPGDDLPRLAFADWCDENGDPERAEYVRLGCELANMLTPSGHSPPDWAVPAYRPLARRAWELWTAGAARWYPGLARFLNEVSPERGFPAAINLSVRRFLAHGEALLASAPTLDRVLLCRLGANAGALADCAALARVRHLEFFETPFRAREAERFFTSAHLGRLRGFSVGFADTQMGPRGARALASCRSLSALESLHLLNHNIYDEGVVELLRCPALAGLRNLNLGFNRLTSRSCVALAQATHLDRLEKLDLDSNFFGGEDVGRLLLAPHLARLETLDVQNNYLGEGLPGLAEAPCAPSLAVFRARNCALEDQALGTLLADAPLVRLRELGLAENHPGEATIAALAAGRTPALADLDLRRCVLTPDLAEALGRIDTLPALRRLALSENRLGAEGLRRFLAGPLAESLVWLDLGETDLGDEGLRVLLESRPLPNLLSLTLSRNRITDSGIQRLNRVGALEAIRWLSLFDPESHISSQSLARAEERFGPGVMHS